MLKRAKGSKGEMINKVIQVIKEAKTIVAAPFDIEQKDGYANIVTTADKETQSFLTKKLLSLIKDSVVLGEEDLSKNASSANYRWIIDPIDGTSNFSRGLNQSAISVALQHGEEIVLGVVYNPFNDDLFYAEKDKGAFFNGKRITTSDRPFADGLLCTAMSLYKKEYAPLCFQVIEDAYYRCNDIRRFGSCALELCYLAAGMCDLYFEIRVFPWDFAAAYLILKEAGGVITTLHGNNVYFDKPLLLVAANNRENHSKLSAIVSKYISEVPYKEEL